MRVIFENEENKDQFLRLADASTLDDLAYWGAIFEVKEDGCYSDFDDDDYDDFEYNLSMIADIPF